MRGGIGRILREASYRLCKLLWRAFDEGRDRKKVEGN